MKNTLTRNEIIDIIEAESYHYDGFKDLMILIEESDFDIYSRVETREISSETELLTYIRQELFIELDIINEEWLVTVLIENTKTKVENVPLRYWGTMGNYDLGDPHWLMCIISDNEVIESGRVDYLEYTDAKNGMVHLTTYPKNNKVTIVI